MKDFIIWKVEDNIGHLVINDPPANKMSKGFFDQLMHLVDNVIPESNVSAIVIYGKGRHFSSGADLEELFENINDEVKYNAQTQVMFKLSERDIKGLNLDKTSIQMIDMLKKGFAVVISRDNLEIGRSTEIKVLPPIYLHSDPRVADHHFAGQIAQIVADRSKKQKKK